MLKKRKITTEIAIEEAKEIHGDMYDYSLLEYVNYQTDLKIICPTHGVFTQKYQKHCKLGRGCWECGKISSVEKRDALSTKDIIKRFKSVHGERFNYSLVSYLGRQKEVKIICSLHGVFEQVVGSHLQGSACPECSSIKRGLSLRKGKKEILKKFKEFHGDFYEYNVDENALTSDKTKILCPLHGEFEQIIEVHYYCGCPKCGDDRAAELRRKIPIELKRAAKNIKRRVKGFIANEGYRKSSSTGEIIGIDWVGLKAYLEDNPYGFVVDCEDLDVDHIIPLSSAKSEEDVYLLNHYTNLQLLPREYNQFVKRDNPFDIVDFQNWLFKDKYNKC